MAIAQNQALLKLCQWQLTALLGLAAIASLFSLVAFYSVLLGALVAIVPSLLFTRYAFRFAGARQARNVLRSFYLGELMRLLSCLIGFAVVFNLPIEISFISLWISFLVCLFVPVVLAGSGQLKIEPKDYPA